MRKFLLRFLITTIAVLVVVYVIPGIIFLGGPLDLLKMVAIVFILNLILKPIVKMISLPLEFATLELVSIAINCFALWGIARFLGIIKITSFWFSGISGSVFLIAPIELPAIATILVAAMLISFVSTFLYWLTK